MGKHYGKLYLDGQIELFRSRFRARSLRSWGITLNDRPRTQAQQSTEGWRQADLGKPNGVLAQSSMLAVLEAELAEGSRRQPPCHGLPPKQFLGRLRLEGSGRDSLEPEIKKSEHGTCWLSAYQFNDDLRGIFKVLGGGGLS